MPRKKVAKPAAKQVTSKHRFLLVELLWEDDKGRTELVNGYCLDTAPFNSLFGRLSFLSGEKRKLVRSWIEKALVGDMCSFSDDMFLIYLGLGKDEPKGQQLVDRQIRITELQPMRRK
jgi:hypothetical protein